MEGYFLILFLLKDVRKWIVVGMFFDFEVIRFEYFLIGGEELFVYFIVDLMCMKLI